MEDKERKVCAIVDAYSAGMTLALAFMDHGYDVVHIQSAPEIPSPAWRKSFFSVVDKFVGNIIFADDLEETTRKLGRFNPDFLMAGCELGVTLADRLRDRLGLYPNDIALSNARRNKYEMIRTLQKEGLHTANQIKSSDVNEILGWTRTQSWPVVLKPINSAGTDNVCICSSEEEVKDVFHRIFGKINFLGMRNDEVLAQSFLKGEEYIVNTVSWEGQHLLSDIWNMPKKQIPGAGRIYDRSELLLPEGTIQSSLKRYVFRALDALRIKYGPAHCEVMLTERGPALIEMGARLDGCNVYANKVPKKILEAHQIELTIEAFSSPANFKKRLGKPNKVLKHPLQIYLQSEVEGTLRAFNGLEKIQALPSFWEIHLKLSPGDPIHRTVDLASIPGLVWLAHESQGQLAEDYKAVRELEKHLYLL